jgi:hypothetical protein
MQSICWFIYCVLSITRYILSCVMVPPHVWNMSLILGQLVFGILVEAHVRIAYVPGDDNMKSCDHAIKLMKGVVYLACIPLWWLIPLSYNNSIGNEPVWEQYAALIMYGDGVMVCVCCLYVVELLYVSIPTVDISTCVHHLGTLLVAYNLKSSWFVIWEFPVVLYGLCFLSGTSMLHLVSYVYHFNRDPLMYKWYRRVGIWIILCVIFFHVSYARALVNSLDQDAPMLLSIVRLLLWGAYIVDHVINLRCMYAIHARLKTRWRQQAFNDVRVVEEGGLGGQMITNERHAGRGGEEGKEYVKYNELLFVPPSHQMQVGTSYANSN